MAAPKITIERYRPEDKPGKYDAEVQALIEAMDDLTPEDIAENGKPSVVVVFPKEDDKGKDQTAKYKRYFQDSAKRFHRTAREVGQEDNGDGSIAVRFILTDQVKRPRKPVEATAEGDTPEAAQDAA